MKKSYFVFICLLGLVVSDNSTIGDHSITEDTSEISNTGNLDSVDQNAGWGEWSPWSKWSPCTRTCGGGISRQQRRCRRRPCKGKIWTTRYKICNPESCEKSGDSRAAQCAAFNNVPYSGQLLKWYPHYDPARPCALICRGEQTLENGVRRSRQEVPSTGGKTAPRDSTDSLQFDSDETIVVQLADKVEDGTRCYAESTDVCIGGECMKVGCDLRVGSNKNTDACGVCGGNGSSCQSRYSWSLESISACSKSCGGGFKIGMVVCKSADESVVEDSYCDANSKPSGKSLMPCNTHPCTTKWMSGDWSACSASCGGGSRTRSVFCTEENGNETTKLPDHKCSSTHKPRIQETCNTVSCPMWETDKWSECSVTCGTGIRTRTIECRDGVGAISRDCDPAERPHTEQECKMNVACPTYGDGMTQPLVQPYPLSPVSEKLMDQPIPSESTFIAEEWSACSVTCGMGFRQRKVHCKIFLEFSQTIAKLPDSQCSGQKPIDRESCTMESCNLLENSLSYRIDPAGNSEYAESSLTDSYSRSSSGSSGGSGYDSGIKVAPGSDVQTTYSWKETGYTPCSATCLGGVQDLIINCVRDDTGKTVMPLLCSAETKPEARIRVCNDHPCPPRWNYSEFSTCMSPCGIGIQTRDVTCIHEVTHGTGKAVPVPNYMCPQPPPADRRYCNVLDCPVKWSTGEWGKCSKTCGGGVKKREVVCEQIMAQGRKQSREERECPAQRPASEKPCNTRACHDTDTSSGVLPIITSLNTTYNQSDINAKVDLKIGGIAKIFQGTPSIKIRCPVRKFDKAQIVWTKDNKEIRKSRKYKISRKGALKIIDIVSSDSGVYGCIAGNSHAETQLIVKFRSKEQISSEEYLRLGNSVHLQRNANLDSAPANSGESPYTDHAAAYGNRFDSEDLSHERAFPSKPTRKPHQKKQKTSPAPSDATMMHKEHTVTTLNQPGYHESVESPAPSSASTLVPHLSYLISSLKAYWPFHSEIATSNSRKTVSTPFVEDGHKRTATTKRRMSNRETDFTYQSVENSFDNLYRNTAIPDETFGPDEERIFIDVDPYDLDESVFGLQHGDGVKSDIMEKVDTELTTKPDIDYIEESLKNVKRQWQESRNGGYKDQWSTTPKSHVQSGGTTESITSPRQYHAVMGMYYVEDSSTRREMLKEADGFTDDSDKSINHGVYGNSRTEDPSTVTATMMSRSLEDQLRIPESDHRSSNRANRTIEYSDAFEEELDKRKIEPYVENHTADYTIARFPTTRDLENRPVEDPTLIDDRRPGVVGENPDESVRNLSRNREDHTGSMEKVFSVNLKEVFREGQRSTDEVKLANVLTSTVTGEDDTTKDPAVESLAALATDMVPVYEWVTTDWSKCSQTCGGSGFQMRGAQCTVRSTKTEGNSTRVSPKTVIGQKLCEDAGYPVPQKVRPCGIGKCPQWHTTEWTPCETSRCFNWKTAMQKRDISCRLVDDAEDGRENVTLLDPSKCDEATRPLQRQECYNDACKGVWRVGEWTECTASCEEDGIKYRILQCVWFGTKKPAGNACRDIPRPPVMKTCRGPPCPQSTAFVEDCKDHSQLCSRVKTMNVCKVPLYKKQCCASCR